MLVNNKVYLVVLCCGYLTLSAAVLGNAASISLKQAAGENYLLNVVNNHSSCFDKTLKDSCIDVLHKVSDESLVCSAYFDLYLHLCTNASLSQPTREVGADICIDLTKFYTNYNATTYFTEQIRNFKLRLADKCNELCNNNKSLCETLVSPKTIIAAMDVQPNQLPPKSSPIKSTIPIQNEGQVVKNQNDNEKNTQSSKALGVPQTNLNAQDNVKPNKTSAISENARAEDQNSISKKTPIDTNLNNAKTSISEAVNDKNFDNNKKYEEFLAVANTPLLEKNDQDSEQALDLNNVNDMDNGDDIDSELGMDQIPELEHPEKYKLKDVEVANEVILPRDDQTQPFVEAEDSHLFSYLLCGMALCVLGYILAHNKNKLLAFVLEGRRSSGSRGGRRRHTASYRKLDSNLEEAITSTARTSYSQVIY